MTMHNEIVSYIQANYAADGVEVRAVGPKAVTLVLPPEMHDLGNFCGELEMQFNARIDIVAQSTAGLGPTATVWVAQNDDEPVYDAKDDNEDDDDDRCGTNANAGNDADDENEDGAAKKPGGAVAAQPALLQRQWCSQWIVWSITTVAALLTVVRHGSDILEHLIPPQAVSPSSDSADL